MPVLNHHYFAFSFFFIFAFLFASIIFGILTNDKVESSWHQTRPGSPIRRPNSPNGQPPALVESNEHKHNPPALVFPCHPHPLSPPLCAELASLACLISPIPFSSFPLRYFPLPLLLSSLLFFPLVHNLANFFASPKILIHLLDCRRRHQDHH
jgi:hypothetical protein